MDDEANLHNNEVCAFCIRSTNEDNNLRQEFIDFIRLIKFT